MKYIIMAAGKGTRLSPLTSMCPKSLYRLDRDTTVLQRTIDNIHNFDKEADIVVVVGYKHNDIENQIKGCRFIFNPFFDVTNSIASLWFAIDEIRDCDVTLINGDVVLSKSIIRDYVCKDLSSTYVLIDSSIPDGDYNVQVDANKVVMMGKNIRDAHAEFVGVTKIDRRSTSKYIDEVSSMINSGLYNQFFEDALIQMIFEDGFDIGYIDVAGYDWTEIDCIDDLLKAKKINEREI